MVNTGIVYSKKYLDHNLGSNHPENPERLKKIVRELKNEKELQEKYDFLSPSKASIDEIETVHSSAYVKKIKKLSEEEKNLDVDTPVSHNTYDLALLSAGGVKKMIQEILVDNYVNGFCLVRPPGHHAQVSRGGGFCYFNNIAIGAKHLLGNEDFERIMIFDFDAHHGNGTQNIFLDTNNVLFMSFHQSGKTLYPGSGFPTEVGEGEGEGFTFNVPFLPGAGDEEYISALKNFFLPVINQYDPEIILVSAGFDAHFKDPLTRLELSSSGFEWLGRTLLTKAEEICDGKISFVLEGGYAQDAAARSAVNIIRSLVVREKKELPNREKKGSHFSEVKKNLGDYWDLP